MTTRLAINQILIFLVFGLTQVNDEAGIRRAKKMCIEYKEKGYNTFLQLPNEKDFNEQLIKYKNEQYKNELKSENDYEPE